ncbi:hypothetical protein ERICI_03813 [Paenibacillus larvae subsp. larvae]|uniref:Uncharacterized protein n=1 Tax=Paenibacillus larvae subsp. larvae TaxID=147375 RepID=A0A2L1TSA4_9BACL|nr:hypothetical protein ERICI_03813 [Paenibacillus larvae subsp. larvae]AVF25023.1 hypothetical protein ERICIII_00816 [Paenibacillus larvae subsp. larvae]AVF29787.1 hypothetical protein ERICIV_00819 [Paenibacillus larvae subsp. larvae]QHZ50067.1 hypothetical protein ERICV_00890 [Paenibacillus larvae subsp. larvae]
MTTSKKREENAWKIWKETRAASWEGQILA